MSGKRLSSKHKIDRRLGVNLWGRPKSPHNKRQTGPGMHGAQRGKPTGYGVQLSAKQRLKGYYGNIGERQFRRYFQEASRMKGDTSQNLIGLLESRLDAIVYRACFAPTVFSARQLVNHRHVTVNGKVINIPSYLVKEGDVVEIREKSKKMPLIMVAIETPERDVPDYIDCDKKALKATYLRVPKLEDVPYPVQIEPNLVVEFYSR
ncbi:MAG: 30S ribosomal protein S4 [Alphaproteobacteria bacterium]|nr:30S ribosomal protein S4 [Alphaproteobacteria bacterium]MBP7759790.1 30S ribosomal protein S4 [Alphaproteobacteria bacterium]MBP7763112.1 30S ribosomal protein S4 [Alphaproteobacteria bacterium]MBP7906006.1 30S ribosomal protein S4 [Alphaproteobacteria bacterium]